MTTVSRWKPLAIAAAIASATALGGLPPATAASVDPADEQYRPYLHFSPEQNWMNDPNGLVYHDGTWHLFFQHNPEGTRWGNMSWGHATSPDLVHWEEQPLAIPQTFDDGGVAIEDIFSGSVVVDEGNTSGFGTADDPAMVAIYTSAYTPAHPTHAGIQAQSLAYSTDDGQTWTKYAANPVLDRGSANFRDPKVIRYTDPASGESYWVMVAVEATQYKVVLYRSDDLKTWTHLSDFGPANATGGIWECPDLFQMAVDGDPTNLRWVLVVNLNPGSVAGGSGGQYFVGDFDGTTFTSESTVTDDALPPGDVFASFDDGSWGDWVVGNEPGNWKDGPWGLQPASGTLPGQNPVTGFVGAGLVNGFNDGDWPVGTLESPGFTIDQDHVNLLVGGGGHPHADDTQLGNEPPSGRLLFDGFEFADGTNLADTGWEITGDFATEAWRNPSTAGGDYYLGQKRLNTWEGGPKGDANVGDLTSPTFAIEAGEDHLSFLLGGGKRTDGSLEVRLLVDGEVVRTATGPEAGQLNWRSWDVSEFAGSEARFQVHDGATGGWGHLTVDHLVLGGEPALARSDETSVNLVVDGEIVRTATGRNSENLDWVSWDVSEYVGQEASVRLIDNNRFGWGHILVDQVMFSDEAAAPRIEGYDWLDWGRDYYATVSFSGAPDGRRVMLGWMNNWDYANDIPTGSWRSAMALPRDVELVSTERGPRLTQRVVPEFAQLERPDVAYSDSERPISTGEETLPIEGDVLRIEAVIDPRDADSFGLSVLGDDTSGTRIGWDAGTERLFVDRRDSGNTDFHPAFASIEDAPVVLDDGRLALTVYVDRSSVEVFADGGRTTITDQVFPNAGADAIRLWSEGGEAWLESLEVTPMHGAMYREAGRDGAASPPPPAEITALTGPRKGPDADGDFEVKVKVGRGEPTTVVRLLEDGRVIDRVHRSAADERTFSFAISGASAGEHRYTIELENSAGTTDGGELLVRVAG
ncbi:GH32 C-terminal domain-containing protein [Agromyces aurantiacus]|uniref:GH32 C-terminal domain-containing protein n=1 Tax=Agromyces aurantiacus TaxID=165814 RepID=A0ABV9R6C0_9MICO|nr:GH32 C-terminal domain-containing protein [Agromyces aurantiacus]MBM7503538.1 levanase [Agromyces aurantiacus]